MPVHGINYSNVIINNPTCFVGLGVLMSFRIYGQEADLGTLGMKDKVSSIVVHSGVWLFYENVGFKGKGLYLKPGSYPDLQQMGMNAFLCAEA